MQATTAPIALDRAPPTGESLRSVDADGHMKVEMSRISKGNVCPYRGSEIPGWEQLGLSPDRIYRLLRDPKELERAAHTFDGKPLLVRHVAVSSEAPSQSLIVGSVGTVSWEEPYLVSRPLTVWTEDAKQLIESGAQRELSAAYRYRAEMTPGVYGGEQYDGVMRDIVGNHVAIVEEGRAGPDVHVADERPRSFRMKYPKQVAIATAALAAKGITLSPEQQLAMDSAFVAADATIFETPEHPVVELSADEMKAACDEATEEKRKEHGEDAELDDQEREEAYERARDKKRGKDSKAKDSKKAKDSRRAKDGKEGETQNEHGKDGEVDHRKDFDPVKAKDELSRELRAELTKQFREAAAAREAVKPLVGVVSLAMDSAEDIYRFALERAGNKRAKTAHVDALPDMIAAALEAKSPRRETPAHAMDSNGQPYDFDSMFGVRAA